MDRKEAIEAVEGNLPDSVFNLRIECKGKTKTFTNIREVNRFLGTHIPGMEYGQVNSELYYRFNRHEFWDDDTEMIGEEWANVAIELLSSHH